jgi:plastocyanin
MPKAFLAAIAGAVALALAAPAPAAPAAVTVHIANFTFSPPMVTVPAGTTITWVNDDDIPHTVVSDDKTSFRSAVLDTGGRFSFTFARPGSFGYFCSIHPHMTGRVLVKPR